jgi:hypothetical protein
MHEGFRDVAKPRNILCRIGVLIDQIGERAKTLRRGVWTVDNGLLTHRHSLN